MVRSSGWIWLIAADLGRIQPNTDRSRPLSVFGQTGLSAPGPISTKFVRFAAFEPNLGQVRSAKFGPISAKHGPNSVACGPMSTNSASFDRIDQSWFDLVKTWAESDQVRADYDREHKLGSISSKYGPTSTGCGPTPTKYGPVSTGFGHSWPGAGRVEIAFGPASSERRSADHSRMASRKSVLGAVRNPGLKRAGPSSAFSLLS